MVLNNNFVFLIFAVVRVRHQCRNILSLKFYMLKKIIETEVAVTSVLRKYRSITIDLYHFYQTESKQKLNVCLPQQLEGEIFLMKLSFSELFPKIIISFHFLNQSTTERFKRCPD